MGVQNNYFGQSNKFSIKNNKGNSNFHISVALSPHSSVFAPLLFAGRLDEGLVALSKAGFNAVEISLRKADEVDPDWLKKQLANLELCVSAFATGRMCLEDSLCLSNTKPEIQKQAKERLIELVKLAARFNAFLIIGGVRGKLSGNDNQKAEQRVMTIETICQCAKVAQELGVFLLLEPINHKETNFINTSSDGLSLIKDIDHPSVRLLLDTYHMAVEGEDAYAAIRNTSGYLGYIHFADTDRLSPGQGQINFPAILKALKDIDYHGFITAEILPIPNDTIALIQTSQYLHSLMNQL